MTSAAAPRAAPLDTAVSGAHTFTVTAASKDGLSTSQTVRYTVRRGAAIRISAARPAPLEPGRAVETGRDEHERTAITADATCRHLRLTLTGVIRAGGTPAAATGTITVAYKVTLPLGPAAGRPRARQPRPLADLTAAARGQPRPSSPQLPAQSTT